MRKVDISVLIDIDEEDHPKTAETCRLGKRKVIS